MNEREWAVRRLREIAASKNDEPLAWAHRLKAREERGEALTLTQQRAWRIALRERAPADDDDDTLPWNDVPLPNGGADVKR